MSHEPASRSTPAPDSRRPEQPDATSTFKLLAEDFATYGRDLTEPGLWAVATHRIGTRALDTRRPRVERVVLDALYKVMSTGVDWVCGIQLPRTVVLGRRVRIWHKGAMLFAAQSIGNDVHLRHDTTFGPVRAGRALVEVGRDQADKELPIIEDGVDVGSGVCVLGGVRIGRGAVIGANSVVLKNVPPAATVLGVPARIVPA